MGENKILEIASWNISLFQIHCHDIAALSYDPNLRDAGSKMSHRLRFGGSHETSADPFGLQPCKHSKETQYTPSCTFNLDLDATQNEFLG